MHSSYHFHYAEAVRHNELVYMPRHTYVPVTQGRSQDLVRSTKDTVKRQEDLFLVTNSDDELLLVSASGLAQVVNATPKEDKRNIEFTINGGTVSAEPSDSRNKYHFFGRKEKKPAEEETRRGPQISVNLPQGREAVYEHIEWDSSRNEFSHSRVTFR